MSVEFMVHFDGQFWVGVLSVGEGGSVRAVRVIFGPEPTNAEIYAYVREYGQTLLQRAARATATLGPERAEPLMNPKRAARQAAREVRSRAPSTAAQEALRLEREASKDARHAREKNERELEATRKRELRVRKAKAKHRGH